MAEESKWSKFLKNSSDLLNLLRQIVILAILLVLIFNPPLITPTLIKIGLALKKAGFTKLSFAGAEQNLTGLSETIEDSGLQFSLEKAIKDLQKAQREQPNINVDPSIKNAILSITSARNNLGLIEKNIEEKIPATPDIETQPVLASKPWVVVIGADRTPQGADWEKNKTINNEGFKDTEIIYRDDSYKWYRTVIPFATEQEAKEAFPQIKAFQNDAFIRDLNKWCEQLEPKESNSVKYKICTPRKTG